MENTLLYDRIKQITKLRFFNRSGLLQSNWQVIAWWEARRIPYNLLVGAMGFTSIILCLVTAIICEHFIHQPIGWPDPPFFAIIAVIAYAIMANVCYTGGWIVELIVRKIWPEDGGSFGKISFTLGLVFSMLLTLLPGILILVAGSISLLFYIL